MSDNCIYGGIFLELPGLLTNNYSKNNVTYGPFCGRQNENPLIGARNYFVSNSEEIILTVYAVPNAFEIDMVVSLSMTQCQGVINICNSLLRDMTPAYQYYPRPQDKVNGMMYITNGRCIVLQIIWLAKYRNCFLNVIDAKLVSFSIAVDYYGVLPHGAGSFSYWKYSSFQVGLLKVDSTLDIKEYYGNDSQKVSINHTHDVSQIFIKQFGAFSTNTFTYAVRISVNSEEFKCQTYDAGPKMSIQGLCALLIFSRNTNLVNSVMLHIDMFKNRGLNENIYHGITLNVLDTNSSKCKHPISRKYEIYVSHNGNIAELFYTVHAFTQTQSHLYFRTHKSFSIIDTKSRYFEPCPLVMHVEVVRVNYMQKAETCYRGQGHMVSNPQGLP